MCRFSVMLHLMRVSLSGLTPSKVSVCWCVVMFKAGCLIRRVFICLLYPVVCFWFRMADCRHISSGVSSKTRKGRLKYIACAGCGPERCVG